MNAPDRGTILVADDCDLNRALFRRLLERAGYNVTETETGAGAIDIIAHGAVDLILLDLNMPGAGGLEVLRVTRQRYDQAALPILVVTAEHDVATAAQCLEAGPTITSPSPLFGRCCGPGFKPTCSCTLAPNPRPRARPLWPRRPKSTGGSCSQAHARRRTCAGNSLLKDWDNATDAPISS